MRAAAEPSRVGRRAITTALAVVAAASCVAGIAFGLPDPVMGLLAQATGRSDLLPAAHLPTVQIGPSRWTQDAGVLPEATRDPLPQSGRIGRLRAIRARPPLTLDTTTLAVPPGARVLRIIAPRLTLRDTTLVANGVDVEIETERLDIANATILAYPPETATAPGAGGGGGRVRITMHGPLHGILRVDLSGQAGAPGTPGAAGLPGLAGDTGSKARSALTTCLVRAGRGGRGTSGAAGAHGGDGAAGGDGGRLEIVGLDEATARDAIRFTAMGGAGGAIGAGGAGGAGGPGGLGGDPTGICFGNGPAGPEGPPGAAGLPGQAGQSGVAGRLDVDAGP